MWNEFNINTKGRQKIAKGFDFRKFVNDILTTKDNETYDVGKVGFVFTIIIYNICTIFDMVVFPDAHFNFSAYAQGVSVIAVAFGAHLFFKQGSEP